MEVLLLHQSFNDSDAIGHDIQGMYDTCQRQLYPVSVFCEFNNANPIYKIISLDDLKKKISAENNILIYHHSIYWSLGESILRDAKCKVIIRYHNITPPDFFENYSKNYYKTTVDGRKQTERLVKNYNFDWLSDSIFNNNEILDMGIDISKTAVMPPFHKVEHMDNFDAEYALLNNLIISSRVNALFIGRVASNKGHMKICRVAKAYRELFGDKVTFWIVGGFDQELSKYYKELNQYISKWGLEENVIFTDKVSMNSLKSYILGCDLFICVSEHEGFCVPLIESQYYKLPIVTCDSSAIAETIGTEQVVFSNFDEDIVASAIHSVATNKEISDFLIEKGQENYYSRFTNQIIEESFIDILNKMSE